QHGHTESVPDVGRDPQNRHDVPRQPPDGDIPTRDPQPLPGGRRIRPPVSDLGPKERGRVRLLRATPLASRPARLAGAEINVFERPVPPISPPVPAPRI